MNKYLLWTYSAKKIAASIMVVASYWFLTQLSNHYLAIDGIISLISPASGIGLIAVLLGGYRFIPAIFIGSLLAYSPYGLAFLPNINLSSISIVTLAIINAIQSALGSYLLKRTCDLSKGINSVKDFYLFWLLGGYASAFVGATLCSMTLHLTNDVQLNNSFIKVTILWWQGNVLGVVLMATSLLIVLTSPKIKDWLPDHHLFEFIAFFCLIFIAGQIIFLDWYHDTLGVLGWGYWTFFYISIAAIRFGQRGVVLVLLVATTQAVYGAIQHIGFFGEDIAETNLTNFWVYIQVVFVVGMLQAIIIGKKRKQATFDYLTNLPNRRLFITKLKAEISRAERNEQMLGVIFIDLDHFKEVNDSLGHHIGDQLLISVADKFRVCVRESDTVARLGGDEFAVIVPDINHIRNIDTIVSKIIHVVQYPFELAGQKIFISASAGVAVYPKDSQTVEDLLKFADQAMYSAKFAGKNRFHYFAAEMQEKVMMKNHLMQDLHTAINSNQLSMYYQPIIDMQSGKLVKAEALIRWNHPEKGFINPEIFIAIAEETGSICMLGKWVTNTVLTQLAQWRQSYNTDVVIAINLSPLQIMDTASNEQIRNTIKQLNIPYELVVLEITERVLLKDREDISTKLSFFDGLHIKLAIDDFGTGYSSLSYIKKYPINFLKIDKSFIEDMQDNKDSQALVKAIIAMASALDMQVIAEGVETLKQHEMLLKLGCDLSQGYLYSKPLPAADFAQLLTQNKAIF